MVGRKLMTIAVSILLMAGFLALFDATAGTEPEQMTETTTRGTYPGDGYFDVLPQSFNGLYYPGDADSFYFTLESNYAGENFDPNSLAIFNSTMLFNVTMTFTGIYHTDRTPVTNDPVVWINNNVYNNGGDGYGFLWQGWQNDYYSDDGTGNQRFEIKVDDITTGDYLIGIEETFSYLDSWDGVSIYNYTEVEDHEDYIPFSVRSCVGPYNSDLEYTFETTRENNANEPLYAGAEFEKFMIRWLNEQSGEVTDLTAEIIMDDSLIEVDQPTCTLNQIGGPSADMVFWRINVANNTLPGYYTVFLKLSYTRTISGNVHVVTETETAQTFTVVHTPLLFPPLPAPGQDLPDPLVTVTQKDVNGSFIVPFRNDGNVPMSNVVVRLDLDTSSYIKESEFFYNENSWASTTWPDLTVELGDVGIGETKDAEFPMIHLIHYLPPGKYMVPLDYTCTYFDAGETDNPTGYIAAGYWDDGGQQLLHRTILQATFYPEDFNEPHMPYIVIEVQEDADGIDIEGRIHSSYFSQTQGTKARYITMEIYNSEYYAFHDMTYLIHTDDGSPFDIPGGGSANDTTLPPIHRADLNAGSTGGIGSDSFWFYADIKDTANPGINYVQVDIMGYDQYLQPVMKTIWVQIYINGKQPDFEVTEIVASNVTDDMEVTVTVTITNVGEGDAIGLSADFESSSTGFICNDDPTSLGDLLAGESVLYEFTVRAAAETYAFHGNYAGDIYFEFTDEMGDFKPLHSSGSEYVRYYVSTKLPDIVITNVDAPIISAGEDFSAAVTIMNIGGSTARSVDVLLPYSSAQFQVAGGGEYVLGDLDPGQEAVITIQFTALDEIAEDSTYSFTLYFSYQNIEGRTLTYSEGEKESFSIRTREDIPVHEERQVFEDKDRVIDEGVAMLGLGILILIGLIIFAAIMVKAGRGGAAAPPAAKESTWDEKPPRAKPVEKEEEWEAEAEDEEEEEIELEDEDKDAEKDEDEDEGW